MLKKLNRKTDLLFHENWEFLQKYQLFVRCRSFLLGAVFLLILLIGKNQILTILIKKIFFGVTAPRLLLDTNILLGIWAKKLFVITRITSIKINRLIHSCSCILVIYFYSSLLTRIFLPFLCFLFCRLFHHCCRFVEQSFQTLSFISFFVCRLSTLAFPGAHCFTTQMCGGMQKWVWVVNFFRSDLFTIGWAVDMYTKAIYAFNLIFYIAFESSFAFFRSCHEPAPNSFKVWQCVYESWILAEVFGVLRLIGWTWWCHLHESCGSLVSLASRSLS